MMMIKMQNVVKKSSLYETVNDDDDDMKSGERMPPTATSYFSLSNSKLGFKEEGRKRLVSITQFV